MKFNRASGILLHPTSLPGPFGIGDLGPSAFRWIDFLSETETGLWQVLPLGPTGYGDSPYQSFSAFAGNPYLTSPDDLLADGLLTQDDLRDAPAAGSGQVDFGAVIPWKLKLLDLAFDRFRREASGELKTAFEQFRAEQSSWLEDFGLFMALKEAFGWGPWPKWPDGLRKRESAALEQARKEHGVAVERQIFRQFVFFHQWGKVRQYCQKKGIQIIGDIPIFVAHDSAEVWARPDLFYMDDAGNPTVVAGVPPDYFSKTGQLWGNPLYRWDVHAESGYAWWIERLKSVLQLVDIVRLDHFRGFAGYWEVPASAKTAEKGRWAPGPGMDFFEKVQAGLGELPIIAEDLGEITPDVVEMRERFELPGMKILQFAFHGDPKEPFLPHNHIENCVVYTGTHDNDTTLGWYQRVEEKERDFARRYLGRDGSNISWDLVREAWSSVAVFALAPMQDFLGLGNEARMNYPGSPSGNWTWRMPASALSDNLHQRIKEFNHIFDRRTPAP